MNEPNLFSDDPVYGVSQEERKNLDSHEEHRLRVRGSAIWAAYGDSLGWISELSDEAGLRKRIGKSTLNEPLEWTRRIGGKFGITTTIPKGCYSDDSQLRLATGRAIGPDGFDVEAFAKVELPVWLSYALGGGKSTTSAAERLANTRRSQWYNNTFKGWSNSGGNGAAMRIQPHAWAARHLNRPETFLVDVIRNTICTHSHPYGMLGAVLHALCVAHVIETGNILTPLDLSNSINRAECVPGMLAADIELDYWRVAFERESGTFDDVWAEVLKEARSIVPAIENTHASNKPPEDRYRTMVEQLQLRDKQQRGSGLLTALAAVGLTWCESRPAEAMYIAANELGTDTDTIATMAGAILGASTKEEPPVKVLDTELFLSEADRLVDLSVGKRPDGHPYPDLLHWSPPKTRVDALVRVKDGRLCVPGLGDVTKELSEPVGAVTGKFCWQWVEIEYGQTVFIKRRRAIPIYENHTVRSISSYTRNTKDDGDHLAQISIQRDAPIADSYQSNPKSSPTKIEDELDLDTAISWIMEHINSNERDKEVGRTLRRVVKKGTKGQIAVFISVLIDLLEASPRISSEPQQSAGHSIKIPKGD